MSSGRGSVGGGVTHLHANYFDPAPLPSEASDASELLSNHSITARDVQHADSASVTSDPSRHGRRSRSQSVSSSAPLMAKSVSPAFGVNTSDNVVVVCRVRPFNARELQLHEERNASLPAWERQELRSVITMEGGATQFLDAREDFCMKEQFGFDENLWSVPPSQQQSNQPFATQAVVFDKVGRPTLQHTVDGYNTCLFAYGQTGSGKTYTMMGGGSDGDDENERGLIPRTCEALFDRVRQLEAHAGDSAVSGIVESFHVEATFLEIYNEHVKDLLWELGDPALQEAERWDGDNLKVRHVPGQGPYVVGLTHVAVASWEHCSRLLAIGMENRSMAATNMNDRSSRSHAVFKITLTQRTTVLPKKSFEKPRTSERVSAINLVDLAGSERNKKSGAQGQRLKEAAAINQSLTTLKNVIDALVEGRSVIPYRESQLTWLLSESLGGNSKTFMIACVSPHADNADETLNTLRYALRTQGIVCHARINESDEGKRISRLRAELEAAQHRLQSADTNERQLLIQEVEERRVAVVELQRARYQKLREEETLREDLDREREATYNAIYSHSFRVLLCERLAQRLALRREVLRTDVDLANREISRRAEQLGEAARRLKRVQQAEADAHLVLQSKQRALREVMERAAEVEEKKRTLEAREDAARAEIAAQRDTNRIARFCGAALMWDAARRSASELRVRTANDSKKIDGATSANEATVAAFREQKRVATAALRRRIEELKRQIAQARLQLHGKSVGKAETVRRLHEAAIFYDRENRALDDDRIARLTELHTRLSRSFDAESAALRDQLAADIEASRAEYQKMMRERAAAHNAARSEAQQAVREAREAGEAAHAAAVAAAQTAVEDTRRRVRALEETVERQLSDTQSFISKWDRMSPSYVTAARDLQRRCESLIAFDGSAYDAAQLARALVARSGDAGAMPVAPQLRTITPAPFATPESRVLSAEAAVQSMTFPMVATDVGVSRDNSNGHKPASLPPPNASNDFARQESVLTSFRPIAGSAAPFSPSAATPVPKIDLSSLSAAKSGSPKNASARAGRDALGVGFASSRRAKSPSKVSLPTNPPTYAFTRTESANSGVANRIGTPRSATGGQSHLQPSTASRAQSQATSTTTPRSSSNQAAVGIGARLSNRLSAAGGTATTPRATASGAKGEPAASPRPTGSGQKPRDKSPSPSWR